MGLVFLDMTMSLDGFVTGPNVGPAFPLGEGGLRLHDWMFGDDARPVTDTDRQIAAQLFDGVGAYVMGRRMFDGGIIHWGDDGAFGKPVFVVTHRPQADVVKGPTRFTFVTDGLESALRQARVVAGDADVGLPGGADIDQQALSAGLVDELRIHIAPVLLGDGTRLFDTLAAPVELERTSLVPTPYATHLRFRVVGRAQIS